MRILHINAVYGFGSTGIIVKDIHNLCLEKGIESYVAYSLTDKSQKDIINGYKIGHAFGKKVHALFCRFNGKQAYFSSFSTYKFIKHIKKIKPDIIHLHNLHSNYINLNMLLDYLAKNNIATVITMHDCWYFTGGCFHYAQANCYKWLKNCGDCPKKMQDTKAYFKDSSSKILNDRKKYLNKTKKLTVVGVSEWITKEAKKTFLKNKNVITIYNGIDVDFFKATPSDFRKNNNLENKFLILGLASKWLKPINKDTFDYIVANLEENERLILIGCNEFQKADLPKNVVGLEFIKDIDYLRKIYSACDVFANCSREDTLSTVNLEVQATGTPVVLYNNTGALDTTGLNCGYVVENGDYIQFLTAIRSIKNSEKSEFEKNCRNWILEKFNKYINYRQYIELYEDLFEGVS